MSHPSREESIAEGRELAYAQAKEWFQREPTDGEIEEFFEALCEKYYYQGYEESEEPN